MKMPPAFSSLMLVAFKGIMYIFGYSPIFTTNISHKSRRKIHSCGSSQIYEKKVIHLSIRTRNECMFSISSYRIVGDATAAGVSRRRNPQERFKMT